MRTAGVWLVHRDALPEAAVLRGERRARVRALAGAALGRLLALIGGGAVGGGGLVLLRLGRGPDAPAHRLGLLSVRPVLGLERLARLGGRPTLALARPGRRGPCALSLGGLVARLGGDAVAEGAVLGGERLARGRGA